MARRGEFVQFVLESMAPLGEIRARAMFGAHAIYRDEAMFAIVAAERLFLRADPATRRRFTRRRLGRFTYVARGRTVALQYYEAPAEVFESPRAMRAWARLAMAAALRSRAAARARRALTPSL